MKELTPTQAQRKKQLKIVIGDLRYAVESLNDVMFYCDEDDIIREALFVVDSIMDDTKKAIVEVLHGEHK